MHEVLKMVLYEEVVSFRPYVIFETIRGISIQLGTWVLHYK